MKIFKKIINIIENSRWLKFINRKMFYCVILAFSILFLTGQFVAVHILIPDVSVVDASKGVLDLTGEDNNINKIFQLEGEWECYPNMLLYPDDFNDSTIEQGEYVNLPHYWKDDQYFNNAKGYATYRIKIKTPKDLNDIGIYCRNQYDAYRIFVNDKQVVNVGNVSKNINDFKISYKPQAGLVNNINNDLEDNNEITITVQMQNYYHYSSGLNGQILLGNGSSIHILNVFLYFCNGLVSGSLIILCVYFFIVYIKSKEKKEYRDFSIVAIMCAYISCTTYGESIFYSLSDYINPLIIYRFEYIVIIVAGYFANIHIVRKEKSYVYVRYIMIALCHSSVFSILLLSSFEISKIRLVYHGIAISFFVISTIYSIKNIIINRKKNDILEFVALLCLLTATVFVKIGITFWIGCDIFDILVAAHCCIHVKIFLDRYSDVETDLKKLTESLEDKVLERTKELTVMKEKAESGAKAKSYFLASMSHEIRTPMNAIIGMTDIMRVDNLDDKQREYFNDIKSTAHSLLYIINDILDFSKIESGKMEICPISYSIYSLIDNVCSVMKVSTKRKLLKFEMNISNDIPKILYGDENRLRQVLLNILNNAVKYTNEGEITFSAYLHDNNVCFSVKDTGIGIKEEDIPKLFTSFQQLDIRKNRNVIGTGLGLAISKNLLDLMGGSISIKSKYGVGSEFIISIPIELGNIDDIERKEENGSFVFNNVKVLVVDDNIINLKVARGMLEKYDIDVKTVLSGSEAIDNIKDNDYDVVFMDHMMPGMDGIETTKRIRKLGPKYKDIPIVALTANAIIGTKKMFIDSGMNDFVSKPIQKKNLEKVLLKWIDNDKITYIDNNNNVRNYEENKKTQNNQNKQDNDIIQKLNNIDNVDIHKGLSYLDGDFDLYISVVKQYIHECDKYLNDINSFYESKDYHNYSIMVHGIKSNLKNIGNDKLSELAYKLEVASKNNNHEYVQNYNDSFVSQLQNFNKKLSQVFSESINISKNRISKNEFLDILKELNTVCLVGDCNKADELCEKLKHIEVDKDIDKDIALIIDSLESLDYDVVEDLSKKYLK